MSNIHRLRLTDRIFFVTVNLRPSTRRFSDCEYPLILRVMEASRQRLRFLLYGYVLMSDHWHAMIWAEYPLLITQVLHDVKTIMALRIHAMRSSHGPFWQHQFWDRFVRHQREFAERLEYMHLNPVRRGVVARRETWRWSSCNNFALDKATVAACPMQIDYVALPVGYRARKDHGQKGADRDGYQLWRCAHNGRPLGPAEFTLALEERTLRRLTPSKSGRPRKPLVGERQQVLTIEKEPRP